MRGLVTFADSLGIRLWSAQAGILNRWGASGKRRLLLAGGRRIGKDLMIGLAAIHNSTVPDYSPFLRAGERRHVVIVANRQEQAAQTLTTIRELLDASPDVELKRMVDERACTSDQIVFKNNVRIVAMPCSSRSTRGLAISLLVMNEAASMTTDSEGYAAGKKVYQALLPSTIQFKDMGYTMILSSPLGSAGIFWELFQAGTTGRDPELHVEQWATWQVNPTVTRESLEPLFLADGESANSEYGAQFASGQGRLLDADAVTAAVAPGRKQLGYLVGARYQAVIDPAFASAGSEFTCVVGHPEYEQQLDGSESVVTIVDRLVGWRGERGPLNSDAVLDEIAVLLREFHLHEVISDQYSVVPISDGLRRRGIDVVPQPLSAELKGDIYAALKRSLNMGTIELLDDPILIGQLLNMQVRSSPSGRPKISAASGRDDRAMVVATLVHSLTTATEMVADNYPLCATVGTRLENFE